MDGTIAYSVIGAALLAVCMSAVRAVRLYRTVTCGRNVLPAGKKFHRIKLFLIRGIPSSTGTFFDKTTPAVLHSVLVLSFILMAADFILTLTAQVIPAIHGGGLMPMPHSPPPQYRPPLFLSCAGYLAESAGSTPSPGNRNAMPILS